MIFNFEPGSESARRYGVYRTWATAPQGYLDFQSFMEEGWNTWLMAYCQGAGIWPLVRLDDQELPHATREFYSTLKISRYTSTQEAGGIKFRLGGRMFSFSADELAQTMGFYTPEQVANLEVMSLATIDRRPVPNPREFWKDIAWDQTPYSARSSKAKRMKIPRMRLLHLLFRRSITARKQSSSGGVVNTTDLWLFYCLEKEVKVHLGDLLVNLFRHISDQKGVGVLFGGGYIARLVRRLGVMDSFGADPLFERGFPITVRTLKEHGVPSLLAKIVDEGPDVREGEGADFPPDTVETLAAQIGGLQMNVSDVLDSQIFLSQDFHRFDGRSRAAWENLDQRTERIESEVRGLRQDLQEYIAESREARTRQERRDERLMEAQAQQGQWIQQQGQQITYIHEQQHWQSGHMSYYQDTYFTGATYPPPWPAYPPPPQWPEYDPYPQFPGYPYPPPDQ